MAADRAGVAADVRAVAQPDREAVAVAPSGRAEVAPPGGGLAGAAGPGQSVPGPIRRGVARFAPLCGAAGQGEAGPGPEGSALITVFESQNPLGWAPPTIMSWLAVPTLRRL